MKPVLRSDRASPNVTSDHALVAIIILLAIAVSLIGLAPKITSLASDVIASARQSKAKIR